MTAVISMWSGPRNISTTMMRSFGARPDTEALDEPFYATYLKRTGAAHPFRKETLAAYPNEIDGVINWIEHSKTAPILFLKHISYHLEENRDLTFIEDWRNFILIRDPRAMVASFADKFDDVAPVVQSFETCRRIFDHLSDRGLPCPIVDAADILRNPAGMLSILCSELGIAMRPEMLKWSSGARPEDGPWAPHWYGAVQSSTVFQPYVEKKPVLSQELETLAALAAPAYRRLHAFRLAP